MRRLVTLGIAALLLSGGLRAQERLLRVGSVEQRRSAVGRMDPSPWKIEAELLADSLGIPDRLVFPDGRVREIRRLNPFGKPEYLTTMNLNAARTVSTDEVWSGGGGGYDLTGSGIVVGVWDGGVYRNSHVEFGDRAVLIDQLADVVGHATHVGGTIGAQGEDPNARGMASEVVMEGYDWDRDLQEMEAAAGDGMLISNHSYGFITGWDYNPEENRWEWYGDLNTSSAEDYLFGFYHREAQEYDRVAYRNPYYLIVKSAGNDRGEGPSPGTEHYVWNNGDWEPSTEVRQRDGGSGGFDSMGPVSNAKNILAVGAIGDLPSGYTGPENVAVTSFSAFGPTDDGRVKPDLVGNGEALYSAYSASDTDYRSISGTSMSAPNIAGSLALIQEHHFNLYGTYMRSSALKGLVLHTANDAGNAGPDYKTGWGVLNTRAAVDLLSDSSFDRVVEDSLREGEEYRMWLFSNGEDPLRITLCWTDPAGTVPEPALDPVSRILVNDLDVRLIRDADGEEFQPYVLDPLHPGMPAITGDNVVDNTEQIYLEGPQKGFYQLVVSHKGTLVNDVQHYSLVISGLMDEFFASGITTLTDNNGEFTVTSAPEYLPDMDAGWHLKPENGLPLTLYFDFFATESGGDMVRIYDGPDSTAPLIAELDGTVDTDAFEVQSSGGDLFVAFFSDSQDQDRGFRALYCTESPDKTPAIAGRTYPCKAGTGLYLAGGSPGSNYSWVPPQGWQADSVKDDRIYLRIGSDPGTLRVAAVNRCGAGPDTGLYLEPLDTAPVLEAYTADTIPCAGSASVVEVADLPGASYKWTLPVDWLGTSKTHRLEYVPGFNPGTIRVTATNSCGAGDTVLVPIEVKQVPGEIQILTTRDEPCAMSMQQFFVVPREDHTYSWEAGQGWSIAGDAEGDTVAVHVGDSPDFMFVTATNKCGSRKSNKLFITAPAPENPLIRVNSSPYPGYRVLSVDNAGSFTAFSWYRNGEEIASPLADFSEYVAFLPGNYTVEVTNRDGCTRLQSMEQGIDVLDANQVYSVYAGGTGTVRVWNTTSDQATLRVYDFKGRILKISTVDPGLNDISWNRPGAFLFLVSGPHHSVTRRMITF